MKKLNYIFPVVLGIILLFISIGSVFILFNKQDNSGGAVVLYPNRGGTGTSTLPVGGDLLMGDTNNTYAPAELIAGTNITIATTSVSDGRGSITINSSGGTSSGQAWEIDANSFLAPTTTITTLLNNGFISQASSTISAMLHATGGVTGALTGNADTATALAANGGNCSAGNSPLGVDTLGAVENCFDVWTEAENTSAGYTSNTGTVTSVAQTVPTGLTISGSPVTTTGTLAIAYDTGYSSAGLLTASTTNWNSFYDTPSGRITAGAGLSWSTNTLNAEVQTSDLHSAITVSGTPDYITLSGQDIVRAKLDISDDTNATGGVGIDITTNDFTLDLTELNTMTFGSGTFTTLTIDAGATDPVWTYGSNLANLSTGNLGVATATPMSIFSVAGTTTVQTLNIDNPNHTGTTTIYAYSTTALFGGEIILEDANGNGCTSITTSAGTLISKIISCPPNPIAN